MIVKVIKATIAALFLSSFMCLQAQTFREWFKQKKTQKEYLIQQISALWAYGSQLKTGYDVIKDGTGIIGGSVGSEFNLHKDYFGRLKEVDAYLLKNGKVESVIELHTEMEKQRTHVWRVLSGSDFMTGEEKQHIRTFLEGLARSSDNELQDMQIVLSPGMLELTDDERIKRLDKVYRNSQEIYRIHKNNLPQLIAISDQRQERSRDMELLRRMYGFDR